MNSIAASQRVGARPAGAAARVQPTGAVPRGMSTAVSSQQLHQRLLQLAEAEKRLALATGAPHQRCHACVSATRDSEVPSSCDTLCIVSWDEDTGGGGGLWGIADDPEEQ